MFFFQADLRSKTTRLLDIHGIIVIRFKSAKQKPRVIYLFPATTSLFFFFLTSSQTISLVNSNTLQRREDERAMAVVGEHEMLLKEWFFFFLFFSLKSKVLLFLVYHTKQTLNFFQN